MRDVESVRRCAEQLEQRIAQLGGAPPETAAERLARHASRLAAVSDPTEAEGQILDAAIDVGPFDSCALVVQGRDGASTAPLGRPAGRPRCGPPATRPSTSSPRSP